MSDEIEELENRMSRSSETIRLDAPDPHFRLTPEERASVREGFDVDALERLLAAVEPEVRPGLLHDFQLPNPGELEPGEFVTPPTRMGDPALQPLLDEVWASAWERFAPDALDDDRMNYPGKEIARQRRRASMRRSKARPRRQPQLSGCARATVSEDQHRPPGN